MAGGHDTTAADKLKDVNEDLRHGKGKKSDVNVYEDEFQDSFEQLSEKGEVRVITKLPNSEQSNKGKVKTHKYINRQNQSTTEDKNPTSETAAAHDSDTNISELEKQLKELQMER